MFFGLFNMLMHANKVETKEKEKLPEGQGSFLWLDLQAISHSPSQATH